MQFPKRFADLPYTKKNKHGDIDEKRSQSSLSGFSRDFFELNQQHRASGHLLSEDEYELDKDGKRKDERRSSEPNGL